MELLNHDSSNFDYPREFIKMLERNLIYFEPWFVLSGQDLVIRYEGMKKRYPSRKLIPFARREDNDDVACWDLDNGKKVIIIHDFAELDWEQVEVMSTFYDWIRRAVDDRIAYDSLQ